jgi:hypothetical protein
VGGSRTALAFRHLGSRFVTDVDAGVIEWSVNPRSIDDRRLVQGCSKFIRFDQDVLPHLHPLENPASSRCWKRSHLGDPQETRAALG